MMRDRWLIQLQRVRELTHAYLALGPRKDGENGEAVVIAQRLKKIGLGFQLDTGNLGRLAASLYRHISILNVISTTVNITGWIHNCAAEGLLAIIEQL